MNNYVDDFHSAVKKSITIAQEIGVSKDELELLLLKVSRLPTLDEQSDMVRSALEKFK